MNNTAQSIAELGRDYQLDLIHEIITDHKFGESVINILEAKYFSIDTLQKIITIIKNYYEKHEVILNFPNLITEINIEITSDQITFKNQLIDTINEIAKKNVVNKNVQEYTTKFCKLQSLRNIINQIKPQLDRGIPLEYDDIEKKLKNALIFKDLEDPIEIYHNIDGVFKTEERERIPTGIEGIDELISGGLGKGELALVIAALGVGKTTFLTKVANTAYMTGEYNVLQIYFEDKNEAIQQKHFSLMSDLPLSEFKQHNSELIKSRVLKSTEKKENHLFLYKLPAEGVTVNKIKNIIKKLNARGTKIDLLVVDYIDCLNLEKESYNSEEWSNEGKIMRALETVIEELDVACWTATQGNRSSTSLDLVKTENMGGSLKKAQIAHFILGIGKTLPQKETKCATISVLKNRLGPDGKVFENCKYDNDRLLIDTADMLSEAGFEEKKNKLLLDKARIARRNILQSNLAPEQPQI